MSNQNTALSTQGAQSLQVAPMPEQIAEKVLVGGDLSALTPAERLLYVGHICETLGLNPATRPFEYITLQGKLTLYARRDATEQIRRINGVSITSLESNVVSDIYIVTAYAQDRTGRHDISTGAVSIKGLAGEALANAMMKAETKAKRRVTLSMFGLGIMDESEAEDAIRATQQRPASASAPTPISHKVIEEAQTLRAEAWKEINEKLRSLRMTRQERQNLVDAATGFKNTDVTQWSDEEVFGFRDLILRLKDQQAVADYVDRRMQAQQPPQQEAIDGTATVLAPEQDSEGDDIPF